MTSEIKSKKSMRDSCAAVPKEIMQDIYIAMLDSYKMDDFTKGALKEKFIDSGKYKYLSLIRKFPEFLTTIRLMVLVDYVDLYKVFKYYLNEYSLEDYDKTISKDYNLISGLHSAELKLIMLEHLYEIFESCEKMDVVFHQPEEKIDVFIETTSCINVNMTDNEGYIYVNTLNPGKYAFESRSCSSITDASYIINNEKRKEYLDKFDKCFLFVPRDATIYEDILKELEHNNIKIIFSDYSTIDIVNDVAYMEGVLRRD